MKKIAILFNPKSGKNRKNALKIKKLKKALDEVYSCSLFTLKEEEDIELLTIEICQSGYDLIIGCGGDGTINYIINGLMKCTSKCRFAIYPIGTANDYGKSLGMSPNVDRFVQTIKREKFQKIDLGKANERYFINVAAGGTIADLGYSVPYHYKKRLGKLAYYLYGLFKFNKIINKENELDLLLDNEPLNQKVIFFLVTKSPFVAGFRNILPLNIKNNDGYLHLVMVQKVKLIEMARILYKLIVFREVNHKKVFVAKAKEIKINCEEKLPIDLDGEFGGKLPITLKVYEKVIDILVG